MGTNVNDKFEFYHMDPSSETEERARSVFNTLLERAPADATIQAILFRTPVGYACRVRINAGDTYFGGEDSGRNPYQALTRVEEKICQQIDLWKKTRFCKLGADAKVAL